MCDSTLHPIACLSNNDYVVCKRVLTFSVFIAVIKIYIFHTTVRTRTDLFDLNIVQLVCGRFTIRSPGTCSLDVRIFVEKV